MDYTISMNPDPRDLSALVAKLKSYLQTEKEHFGSLLCDVEALPDDLAAERLREDLLSGEVHDGGPDLLKLYTACRQVFLHHDNMQALKQIAAHMQISPFDHNRNG